MQNDLKSLRVLQEEISIKDILKEDFLVKLEKNFDEIDIFPVGIAFALKKDDVAVDMINLTYRDDDDLENNVVLIDVQKDPTNMDNIRKVFE
jgi:hypothetical protein